VIGASAKTLETEELEYANHPLLPSRQTIYRGNSLAETKAMREITFEYDGWGNVTKNH